MKPCAVMTVLLGVVLLSIPSLSAAPASADNAAPWVKQEALRLERTAQGVTVVLPITNPLQERVHRSLEVAFAKADGSVLSREYRTISLAPGQSTERVPLTVSVPENEWPTCLVRYELGGDHVERGGKTVVQAVDQLETRLIGYDTLQAGSNASLRLVALNHATNSPVEGADVSISLAPKEGAETLLFSGKTRPDGCVDARFAVPDAVSGSVSLRIEVAAAGLGTDRLTQSVNVKRETKILLTTDKPLYQPGQNIQIRALCLKAATLDAAAKQPLVFEVMDSKGNKVFKQKTETDPYGIASATFTLANEVNLGGYTVRAILGDSTSEKQVSIEKYVLPKFKVDVKTDKPYYLPGERVKGEVQSDYFFGKPVAGGKVHVKASKFEIQFDLFAEAQGALDENGHWAFEIALPEYFAGTPIEQGKASVRFEVEVVDTADHAEQKTIMTPVAAAPLTLAAIPESGALVPGLENRVFILVAYPDGSPAANARVHAETNTGFQADLDTDDLGVATAVLKPTQAPTLELRLSAKDKEGRAATKPVQLSIKPEADGLIVRTDKTLYQVGDTLRAEVFAGKSTGTVYFDIVRQGQTILTRAADIQAGKAQISVELDAAMSGSIVLQAYRFTPRTDLVRDTRLLYVNPANALQIGIQADKETYLPAEKARIQFHITDAQGAPTPAALGIAIVDESVFALQEIHPGLEKVYFTLEQEIMKPRYEIHGFDLPGLVKLPMPVEPKPLNWSEKQQEAACVLLASAAQPPMPPVRQNTFSEKDRVAQQALQEAVSAAAQRIGKAFEQYLRGRAGSRSDQEPQELLKTLVRQKALRHADTIDPWGNEYAVEDWGMIRSCGPDGVKRTADDICAGMGVGFGRGGVKGEMLLFEARPMAAPMAMLGVKAEMAKGADMKDKAAGAIAVNESAQAPGQPPVRIREYFPETLLFKPSLITDAQGNATLDVDMADSITTWRMTTMASSQTGALGSKDAPIRVFQDFFVDIDLPVALTQHDKVSIPVVVYNYLDGPQDVQLKFETEPWFKLEGPAEQAVQLESKAVRAIYFPIEVVELGKHKLTVHANGSKMSDAIRREIAVLPDGQEKTVSFSDRLSGKIEHTISLPGNAVPGASKILVRVYPGVFSQIVDGLDSMLQMPSGCFEQTSSSTYPDILILQYLKATKLANPEIQMKAEGFINAGYQRLLAYEVQGGGFSWFGNPPANQVLTAWGVKEFQDMSLVHEVDPAVIARTRQWLFGKQAQDGSWSPDEQYLHQESWGGIQKSKTLVTAYIADALISENGPREEGLTKAVGYLKANWRELNSAYALALAANAFAAWDKNDPATAEALQKLYDMRVDEKNATHWKGGSDTVTFTHGDAADIEATALAAIAFMKAGRYPETVTQALTYLVQKKQASGHWGSTQATILALKALVMALANQTEKVNATVTVALNGESVADLAITPDDSDVMRLVDLSAKAKSGDNNVTLTLSGEGSMLYQVAGIYYVPWEERQVPGEAMAIEVKYDKTQLAVNDLATATVTVSNHKPAAAKMAIVDLGIPPGFQVMTPDLDELVTRNVIQRYEMTGRQIILYFDKIDANASITFSYKLRAKFPLRAQTPQSKVYEYYNPENNATDQPKMLTVS